VPRGSRSARASPCSVSPQGGEELEGPDADGGRCTRVSTAPGSACSRCTGLPVAATARARRRGNAQRVHSLGRSAPREASARWRPLRRQAAKLACAPNPSGAMSRTGAAAGRSPRPSSYGPAIANWGAEPPTGGRHRPGRWARARSAAAREHGRALGAIERRDVGAPTPPPAAWFRNRSRGEATRWAATARRTLQFAANELSRGMGWQRASAGRSWRGRAILAAPWWGGGPKRSANVAR